MLKLALQFVREAIREFGLAHCVYHPDDLHASDVTTEDDGGPSGPGRMRRHQHRWAGFNEVASFA